MRRQLLVWTVILAAGFVTGLTTQAEAQATRTWVSGVGDDANPCSRTAPCKTFAGAISKTAAGGYIDVVDPGGFGAVTITKSITIDGGPFMSGVLAAGTNGIVVNGMGINVTLRNLDIEGAGSGNIGVSILQAGAVHIEHCNIIDFTGGAINFNPSGAGSLLFVLDTTTRHTLGVLVNNGRITIDNLRAEANAKGVFANANALVTVRRSTFSGGGEGVTTTAASAVINVEDSVITNNVFGVDASGGGTVRLGNTGVLSNSNTGLFNDGASFIVSMQGNDVVGNITPGVFTSTIVKQ
jgi:parallel beta helix pectate lyase-like protein